MKKVATLGCQYQGIAPENCWVGGRVGGLVGWAGGRVLGRRACVPPPPHAPPPPPMHTQNTTWKLGLIFGAVEALLSQARTRMGRMGGGSRV